ncbi:uncharacterized protein LOC127586531 [Pristis pectinata]|uniref:uncharacterized protein LOC127586531 n=1 Tax=Pristis pectinata TaxID=685728 RepID=UPI00223E4616|nr:uncharacterized protein LOC127586531 [Pristis pectinata]
MASLREICWLSSWFALGSLLMWSALAFKSELLDEGCCKEFFPKKWKESAFGEFSPSYKMIRHCAKTQSALLVNHKRRGKVCLNFSLPWVKKLKDYIDNAQNRASLPRAVKQFDSRDTTPGRQATTGANPRSDGLSSILPTTAVWNSTLSVKTTQSSMETPTWTPPDHRPVTATSDQTPGANPSTPEEEKSVVISTVFPGPTPPLGMRGRSSESSSLSLTSGHRGSKENFSEGGMFTTDSSSEGSHESRVQLSNSKAALLIFIPVSFLLLLLSITAYKWCKKSKLTGTEHHSNASIR